MTPAPTMIQRYASPVPASSASAPMPEPTAIATFVTVRSTARACTRWSPSNARAMIAMRVEFAACSTAPTITAITSALAKSWANT